MEYLLGQLIEKIDKLTEMEQRNYELQIKILQEQQKSNDLLMYNNLDKDPNELLTIEQVKEETGYGLGTVQKMFRDPEFQVQRYTTPFKVARYELNRYTRVSHDYLSERR